MQGHRLLETLSHLPTTLTLLLFSPEYHIDAIFLPVHLLNFDFELLWCSPHCSNSSRFLFQLAILKPLSSSNDEDDTKRETLLQFSPAQWPLNYHESFWPSPCAQTGSHMLFERQLSTMSTSPVTQQAAEPLTASEAACRRLNKTRALLTFSIE